MLAWSWGGICPFDRWARLDFWRLRHLPGSSSQHFWHLAFASDPPPCPWVPGEGLLVGLSIMTLQTKCDQRVPLHVVFNGNGTVSRGR